MLHRDIVRAYDIRGTFGKNLFEDDAATLAQQFIEFLRIKSETLTLLCRPLSIIVGRDARHSSPILHQKLIETLLSLGAHVIDLGIVSSPMLYFAEKTLSTVEKPIDGAIMITASHNPKEDNGFKMIALGEGVFGETLQKMCQLPVFQNKGRTRGQCIPLDIVQNYTAHTLTALTDLDLLKNFRIAWDFSGGAVVAAKNVLTYLPGQHFLLNDTFDPDFSSHPPDPTVPENMEQLAACVTENSCALGIGFDGDGDRVGVLDHTGTMISGDRLLTLLSQEVLEKHPGATILGDMKSSCIFLEEIARMGGYPLLTRTGHSYIKAKIKETGALLAGEMSGHIFFNDRSFGYDDGLYGALRILNLLSIAKKSLKELDNALPRYATSPEIRIPYGAQDKFDLVENLAAQLTKTGIAFSGADGVRLNNPQPYGEHGSESLQGWWLIRASNTQDLLIVRFEGYNESQLTRIKHHYNETLRPLDPSVCVD